MFTNMINHLRRSLKRRESTDLSIEERRIKADCGVVCVYLHVGSTSSYVI